MKEQLSFQKLSLLIPEIQGQLFLMKEYKKFSRGVFFFIFQAWTEKFQYPAR